MATSTYELIVKATDKTNGPLRNINNGLNRVNATANKVNNSFKLIGTALAGIATGAAVRGIIKTTARFQDLEDTLASVTGSAEKGAKAFAGIKKFSTQTQFGVEELTETYIKLAGAGIQPTTKLLTTFTDTAAVTTDQIGTLTAITDLLSRTTSGGLGLEELNRLADRGVPVFKILEEQLGLTRLEISEFGKTAEGAQKITEALLSGLDERFGGATQQKLDNLSTAMSNFQIAVKNAAADLGEGLNVELTNFITNMTTAIEKNQELTKAIGVGLGDAVKGASAALKFLAENFDVLRNVIFTALGAAALNQAFLFFNALAKGARRSAFTLTALVKAIGNIGKSIPILGTLIGIMGRFAPIGTVIIGLVGAFTYFQDTLVVVGETTASFGEVFRAVMGLLGEQAQKAINFVTNGFSSMIDFINNMLPDLTPIFGEVFSKFGEIAKTAINFVINTFIASFMQIKNIVYQLPQFFVGAFKGVLEVADSFGGAILQKFSDLFEAIKLAGQFKFSEAFDKLGEDTGFSFAKSFEKGFGDSGIELLDTSDVFKVDRVEQATGIVIEKSKALALTIRNNVLPVYEATKTAIEKKIIANRAEQKAIEDANQANKETAETIDDVLIPATENAGNAAVETAEKVKTLAEQINESITESGKSFSQSLARNLAQGKASLSDFSSFLNKVLEDIAAMIIQKRITDPLIEGILGPITGGKAAGGGIGGLLGGLIGSTGTGTPAMGGGFSFGKIFSSIGGFFGLANGGIARAGQPYMVGERGAEMFIPNTTGQVVSNEQLAGKGETVVNFNINAIDTQTGMEFLLKNKPQIIGMVSQAHNQRGRAGITS